jgi:signal transduction histidine kinase
MLRFRNLQNARGTTGFGLTIPNKAVVALGGMLVPGNSRLGGLHVRITLPAPRLIIAREIPMGDPFI